MGIRTALAAIRAAIQTAAPVTYPAVGFVSVNAPGLAPPAPIDGALMRGERPFTLDLLAPPTVLPEASALSMRFGVRAAVRVRYALTADHAELLVVIAEDLATICRVLSDANWYNSGATGLDSIRPVATGSTANVPVGEDAVDAYIVVTVEAELIYREE